MRVAFIAYTGLCCIFGAGALFGDDSNFPTVTNLSQLRQLSELKTPVAGQIHLEGDVLWADPAAGKMVLKDDSGVTLLAMDLRGQPVAAGERARVTGNGPVMPAGGSCQLGVCGAVVDNNGVHFVQEKSGSIYLEAGLHPLILDWFNDRGAAVLKVAWSGPDFQRQKISKAVLFRPMENDTENTNQLVNGLDYQSFEVSGEILPDTGPAVIFKSGVTSDFNASVRSRSEHVGLKFSGWIEVPSTGLYTFYLVSDDGSRLFIDAPSFQVEAIGTAAPAVPEPLALGQAMTENCEWAQVSGTVTFVSEPGKELELRSGTGRMRVQLADTAGLVPGDLLGRTVRATGVCISGLTTDGQKIAGTLLVSSAKSIETIETIDGAPANAPGTTNGLPVLTSAAEVQQLKREEAQRGYPVDVRGVVTCVLPDHLAVTIQDATRGLYVADLSRNRSHLPEIGDYVEIKGPTDPGQFAPIVNASEVTDLGAGHLPDPVRPTWDQLINGSLDAQYVELQGIVAAVKTNGVTLLMREGRINVELRIPGMSPEAFEQYQNALVRVRGCLFANWNYVTHEVVAGEVRLYGAAVSVEQPAAQDVFATPAKTVSELLLFDPQAGGLQRVKVSGQILHGRDTEYFMTDGKNGLRFMANKPPDFLPGDLVEVVGFPELSGVSPVLREAVARKTGRAPLPPANVLGNDNLIRSQFDSSWVQVNGVLVDMRETPTEQLLEIQAGLRTFVARLPGGNNFARLLPAGSRLKLTGVYSGQGGDKAVGREISSFELLLNNPSGVEVLARPPWWNLQRLLVTVGALACVLAVTALWITQLHRKVEARTAELEIQIKERQRVEQLRAMEQERARVAQDLHDELGSSLTEISMLSARARAATATDERRKNYLEQMGDKAREIVVALDEIVWAMNPRHDSLASLVSYFSLYADRFLGLANIAWRLENATAPGDFAVDSRSRHGLFLAFKEALTNVVRHSRATEVRLRIELEEGEVRLSIADNGCGLSGDRHTDTMDGVANMRARVEKLGGRFELTSRPERGTTLRFCIPASNIL